MQLWSSNCCGGQRACGLHTEVAHKILLLLRVQMSPRGLVWVSEKVLLLRLPPLSVVPLLIANRTCCWAWPMDSQEAGCSVFLDSQLQDRITNEVLSSMKAFHAPPLPPCPSWIQWVTWIVLTLGAPSRVEDERQRSAVSFLTAEPSGILPLGLDLPSGSCRLLVIHTHDKANQLKMSLSRCQREFSHSVDRYLMNAYLLDSRKSYREGDIIVKITGILQGGGGCLVGEREKKK